VTEAKKFDGSRPGARVFARSSLFAEVFLKSPCQKGTDTAALQVLGACLLAEGKETTTRFILFATGPRTQRLCLVCASRETADPCFGMALLSAKQIGLGFNQIKRERSSEHFYPIIDFQIFKIIAGLAITAELIPLFLQVLERRAFTCIQRLKNSNIARHSGAPLLLA
jgi:hypothetical protein